MKKSNQIILILFAVLYLIPWSIFIYYKIYPDKQLCEFSPEIKVIQIENKDLKAENIHFNEKKEYDNETIVIRSYLYYKGSSKYLPEATVKNDTLLIGMPIDSDTDKNISLTIQIRSVEQLLLNGQTIYEK